MKKVELVKDWEVMNERVILAGSFVMVPEHAAEQLANAGYIVTEEPVEKPENKTPKKQ
jgi:hypothetical protein